MVATMLANTAITVFGYPGVGNSCNRNIAINRPNHNT